MMRLIAAAAGIENLDTTGVALDDVVTDPGANELLADAIAVTQDLHEVSMRKRHVLTAALGSLTDEEAALTGTALTAAALRAGLLDVLKSGFPDEPYERWAQVLRTSAKPASQRRPVGRPVGRPVAGFYADAINRDRLVGASSDPLRIRGDVDVLASVIASSRTKPPLSLGIFGDWGAGKSYLMNQVRLRVSQLAKRSQEAQPGKSYYCCQVVQIEFNAWQYIEGQLWASLVNRVFEGVRDHLGSAYREVLDQIAEQDTAVQQARARVIDAERAVQQAEAPPAEQTIEEFESRHPDLKAAADDLTNTLGLDKQAISLAHVANQVEQLGTLTGRARKGWSGQSRTQWLMLTAVAVLAVVAFAAATLLPSVGQLLVRVGAVLAPIIVLASQILAIGNRALRSGVRILGARDQEMEQFVAAAKEYDEARSQLEQLRAEGPGALYDFVSERYSAEDYRKYLGMLPLIRADLERLATQTAGKDGAPRIERIVLYIDDLDRCPANQVVKVLEAVNLLFGFPLFVVVVAVDSRWLVHSLRHEYAHVFNGVSGIAPTPQDYLEKIIQIPFWLQPMSTEGFGRLVSSLVQPAQDAEAPAAAAGASGGGARAGPSALPRQASPIQTTAGSPARDGASAAGAGMTGDGGAAARLVTESPEPDAEPDLMPETLLMSAEELAFIGDLAPLVHTPRATKRLVNTYQLVRVSVDDIPAFLAAKDYQPLLVLLALVTSTFGLTAPMVRALLDSGAADLPTYLEKLRLSARDEGSRGWLQLRPDLQQIPTDCVTVDAVDRWLPVVSRFSFQSGLSLGSELGST
jgi:hypothetical protein